MMDSIETDLEAAWEAHANRVALRKYQKESLRKLEEGD